MNKLIKSAMMMASVGAMLCIVGCGESNTPECALIKFLKSASAGDVAGYYESTYPSKNEIVKDPSKLNESEKEFVKAIILGMVKDLHLDGLRYLSTKMNGEDEAKVFAMCDATKVTMSFVCRKIDGKWKISADTDDMQLVVDEVLSNGSKGAEAIVLKLIEASKNGALTDGLISKTFLCEKEERDGILEFFRMFGYKNMPEYKNASTDEKSAIEKEMLGMGITSSSVSVADGYAIIGLGKKEHEMTKIKLVEKSGSWMIAGLYIAEVESLKRAEQAENVLEK